MTEISRRIRDLRSKLGKKQAPFGNDLGVSQARVSAWETGLEIPSCESFIKLGNLAIMRKSPPDVEALWFWHRAGVDTQNAMVRAAHRSLTDRVVDPSKTKGVIKVPHLEGGGVPWYVDSRLVPNPGSVAYITSTVLYGEAPNPRRKPKLKRPKSLVAKLHEQERFVELGRIAPNMDIADYYAEQAGLDEASGIYLKFPYPSDVIVIDTSASELHSLWQRLVLIESKGPLDNLDLPRRSLAVGRFYCEPSVDIDRPRFVMRFGVCRWPDDEPGLGNQDRSFRLGAYHPPLTTNERRLLVEGLSPYGPPAGKDRAFVEVMAKAFELAVREFSVPKGVVILGAVLARFEIPNWLKNQHSQPPRKKGR